MVEIMTSLRFWHRSAVHLAACVPDDIRAAGWSVMMHRDTEHGTLWVFCKGNHHISAEARTDREALDDVRAQLQELGEEINQVAWR